MAGIWERFVDVVLGRAVAGQPKVETVYEYLKVSGRQIPVEVEFGYVDWKRPRWPIPSRIETVSRLTCDSVRWSPVLEKAGWEYDVEDGRLSIWIVGADSVIVTNRAAVESIHMKGRG